MANKCPHCGAEYDVTLLTFGRRVRWTHRLSDAINLNLLTKRLFNAV